MTRDEALRQADEVLEAILKSGDPELFIAAERPDGTIDTARLVQASLRARERLADRIMAEERARNP